MNRKKLRMLEICALYYFITRASFLGVTSSNLLHLSKQDAWISIIIGSILGLIPLGIFLFLKNRFPNDTIFSMTKKLFHNTIGRVLNIILVIGVSLLVITTFYNMIGFISSQYLHRTPTIAIAIMFLLSITYILTKGISVIARTHVILLYFGILLFLFADFGLMKEIQIENIKPILEFGWIPILKGSLSYVAFNTLPLFVLTSIPKNYIFDNKHYNRNVIITYFLSSISLLITLFFIISIFGPHLALLYQYPEYHLLKLINISGFITRVEGIVALHWLFDLFSLIVMGIYFIIQYVKDDFKLPDKWTNGIIFILTISLLFAVEHIFKNNTIANFITLHNSPFLCFGFLFVIPLIIFIRVLFLKNNVKDKE